MIITARVYMLRPEEGGRRVPLYSGYRAACWFGLFDHVAGRAYNDARLLADDTIEPGEESVVRLEPLHPELIANVVHVGLQFEMAEGTRVICRGSILQIDAGE